MKTRNYKSIEFHNNYSSPKLNLRPINKCFLPQKTFSSGYNFNNKILNLKTSFGNIFSKTNNDKNKGKYLISKDKNNISNRNTYYKTTNFSPESTKSKYSSMKSIIKQKYKRKKINKNINSSLSWKKIEFKDSEKEYNNKNKKKSNIKYIFIMNKEKPKNLKQSNVNIKCNNIELLQKNLIKNNYNNESNNQNKSNKTNITLKKMNKNIEKEIIPCLYLKTMKINEYKNKQMDIETKTGFISPKIVKEMKSIDDNNLRFSEYNNIVKLKKTKNDENKEINKQNINDNKLICTNYKDNNHKNKVNKLNYELNANIDMFDPITLESNQKLNKLFLQTKEKEKVLLKKLLENDKIKELIFKFDNNYEEESKIEESENLNDDNKSIKFTNIFKTKTQIKKYFKDFSIDEINVLFKKLFNKPSEYINYIADKIYKNIDSFRKKNYNSIKDDFIDDNFLFYKNDIKSKTLNKDKFSFRNFLSKRGSTVKNIFNPQIGLNIKKEKFLKTSNSNIIIKNNIIKTEEKKDNDNNIKIYKEEKSFISKGIQTKNYIDEIENKNNKIVSNKNNYKKTFKIKNFDNNIGIKERKNTNKRIINTKKIEEDKIEEFQDLKNIEEIQKEKIDTLNKNEIMIVEENENKNIEDVNEIENDKKEYEHYSKSPFERQKSKTLIKKTKRKRLNTMKKKTHRLKNEEENKKIMEELDNNEEINSLDKFYDFKNYKIVDEFLIKNEIDKIKMEDDLKEKLIENMKHVFTLIKKEKKTKNDYIRLYLCQKRIKYIIKKLAEKDTKKNIFKKPLKDLTFPDKLEDRKSLYRLMRAIENQIKEELQKYDEIEYNESDSDNENSFIHYIYEFLPIEDEEKISLKIKENPKKELIYDNLYLYKDDEDDEQNIEIKKEVYDILNKEENIEKENNLKEIIEPPKSPRFLIKRRKFKKIKKQNIIKKLLNNDSENEEKEKNIISLDNKINDFFDKIKKLKENNIDELDYDKILNELMLNQGSNYNYIEENMMKELRLLNFFKYFQNNRKMDLAEKNYFRNKYIFNSPINFRKSKN